MAKGPVTILIDPPQQRMKEDGLSTLVTGTDWDPTTVSNVFIDPAAFTAMLLPAVLDGANWATSNAGIYAKVPFSGLTGVTDSANWEEHSPDAGGPWYRYKPANTAGVSAKVVVAAINQPMVLEFYAGEDTNSARGVIEAGWGASPDGAGAGDVGLRFFDDGKVEVWKSALKLGEGSISAKKEYLDAILGNQAQNMKARFVTVLLIPLRDRELLIASTQGGAFVHVFEDLADGVAGQTITPAGYFWFNIPAPISCQGVRLAPLQYVAAGSISGKASSWRLAPPTSGPAVQKHIYQSKTEESLALAALTVVTPAYTPVTQENPVQVKLDLTRGPDGQSPFVFGGRAWYDPQVADTVGAVDGDGLDVAASKHLRHASIEFGDNASGTKLHIALTRPDALATMGLPKIDQTINRPVIVMSYLPGTTTDPEVIFHGILKAPKWTDRYSYLDDDSAQAIEIEGNSLWDLAEKYRFGDPIPLDGYSLGDAYRMVVKTIGLPDPIVSASADTVPLGNTGAKKGTDGFNLMIEVGDSGAEWLTRLHETFAGNWFHGITYRDDTSTGAAMTLQDPADLPTTPAVTLYRSLQAAIDSGDATDALEATHLVYTEHHRDFMEPEANDVYVMGMDYRTRRPIIAHKRDVDSADPTLAPADRPDNWLGGIVKYAWLDPALTDRDSLVYAMDRIFPRVTARRELHEFKCQRLQNIVQGDLVLLKGAALDGSDVTVRVKTFGGEFMTAFAQPTGGDDMSTDPGRGGYVNEPFHYVGEAGPLVCPLGVPGTTVREIKQNHAVKGYSDYTDWGKQMEDALTRIPFFVVEVA